MPDKKRPFHEVIANQIKTSSAQVTPGGNLGLRVIEAGTLLNVLKKTEMEPVHAHDVAAQLTHLPEHFRSRGHEGLAKLAEEVLQDLLSHRDD